jgi:thermostable 8-oxoguanine DNA glycosylase
MPRPKQETLDELRNWNPDHNDFSYGKLLMVTEDCSKTVQRYSAYPDEMFSSENMLFCEMVYVVMSLRERFDLNKQQFNDFLNYELGTVDNVLQHPERLEKILGQYGMGAKKQKTIISIANAWDSLDITTKMRKDVKKKKSEEFRLEIVNSINGVGFKFASLFLRMCGYEDIAPPDTWGINFVESRGFVYKREDSGLSYKTGLLYENKLREYAKMIDVSPALFQATIYARWSTWKKDARVEPWMAQYF